jgi:hypothetical protein
MDKSLQTALHHQLSTLQDIIKRMAENSRNVKTWCITIVSALLAFSTKTAALPWFVLALPILPLMYLDMYYLALETFFRIQYNSLKKNYKESKVDLINVYDMESPKGKLDIFYQFRSQSFWPFYGLLSIIAGAIGYFLAIQTSCCPV